MREVLPRYSQGRCQQREGIIRLSSILLNKNINGVYAFNSSEIVLNYP